MADRTVAACAHCGEVRIRASRGLCRRCYPALRKTGQLDRYPRQHIPADEHRAQLDTSDPHACWPWSGAIDDSGYGRVGGDRAHRVFWVERFGAIPAGLVVDHNCHNLDASCEGGSSCLHRRCVNPDHLLLRTLGDNTLASHSTIVHQNAAKTQCPRGHDYDVTPATGVRYCLKCQSLLRLERRARRGIVRKSPPSGVAHPNAMTVGKAQAIQSALAAGTSVSKTSEQFGVSMRTVKLIKRGDHWSVSSTQP